MAMDDEWVATCTNMQYVGKYAEKIAVAQTNDDTFEHLIKICGSLDAAHVRLAPTEDSLWRKPVADKVKAYQTLINIASSWDVDFVVFLTGDTVLRHIHGIYAIIEQMANDDTRVGCAKNYGAEVNKEEWTEEELIAGNGGGRMQDNTMFDFMPHLFIIKKSAMSLFIPIITNPWSIEQCLGNASSLSQTVFSEKPFDFADGVIYNANQQIQVSGV
jgi:hypothetical protein